MYGSFSEDSHDSQGILSHWVGWEVMVTHFDQLVLINFLGMLFFLLSGQAPRGSR